MEAQTAKAQPSVESKPDDYNRIFEILVSDEKSDDDLGGLVAYALYKRAKREWAAALSRKHGRKPNPEDLRMYAETWTESQLHSVQARAQSAIAGYVSAYIDAATPDIRESALRDEVSALHVDLKNAFVESTGWSAFGWAIVGGLISAVLYTLLLILAAYIIRRNGIDLLGLLKAS